MSDPAQEQKNVVEERISNRTQSQVIQYQSGQHCLKILRNHFKVQFALNTLILFSYLLAMFYYHWYQLQHKEDKGGYQILIAKVWLTFFYVYNYPSGKVQFLNDYCESKNNIYCWTYSFYDEKMEAKCEKIFWNLNYIGMSCGFVIIIGFFCNIAQLVKLMYLIKKKTNYFFCSDVVLEPFIIIFYVYPHIAYTITIFCNSSIDFTLENFGVTYYLSLCCVFVYILNYAYFIIIKKTYEAKENQLIYEEAVNEIDNEFVQQESKDQSQEQLKANTIPEKL